jgi:DNA polymerase-1
VRLLWEARVPDALGWVEPVTTLLLDADIIAFQVAAVSQKTYQFPGCEPSVSVDDWEDVAPRIDDAVNKLTEKLKTDKVIVCLSCPTEDNWRLKVLPSYKGNRDYSKRPVLLARVKEYLEKEYPSYRRPHLEADDIMGILSTHPTLVKGKRVIVSEDKDMKTIPGWLFNPAKDKAPRLIDQEEADWWHMYQTLVGDATDGYAGCPGVGPKKAEKALGSVDQEDSITSLWARVLDAYETRGFTEEDALVQARAARICRASDYDFVKKEVIPWTPM